MANKPKGFPPAKGKAPFKDMAKGPKKPAMSGKAIPNFMKPKGSKRGS